MSRPTGRVLTLLELLQSGGTRTLAELAGRLGVDERTVRRYVDHLLELDVPVESVRGRYGGYRLGPGYRVPPLMFTDDEALAVLLGLAAGRRVGAATASQTAGETAAAKIRRVLPPHLSRRLDTVLESLAFTDAPGGHAAPPDADVLLTLADAVRHRRPVVLRYTDREGRRSSRTLHPYGIVAHRGRWYVTGADAAAGADRTLRLDRIGEARTAPGSFEPPEDLDPVARVVSAFAGAAYRYEVSLRVHGTPARIRARLPETVATVTELAPGERVPDGIGPGQGGEAGDGIAPADVGEPDGGRWLRVDLRAERLDWLPGVLASLDLPFVIDRPQELRDRVAALAGRLAAGARRGTA